MQFFEVDVWNGQVPRQPISIHFMVMRKDAQRQEMGEDFPQFVAFIYLTGFYHQSPCNGKVRKTILNSCDLPPRVVRGTCAEVVHKRWERQHWFGLDGAGRNI